MSRTLAPIVLIALFLVTHKGAAQIRGSENRIGYDGAIEYRFDLMQTAPFIPLSAPPDVLAGYMYFQYLATNYDTRTIDSAFSLLSYSDTLKALVKYLYQLDDFDAVLYHRFIYSRTHGVFKSMPAHLTEIQLYPQVDKLYPDTLRTAMLLRSDIIARVRVNSRRLKVDTLSRVCRHDLLVNATIIDPVKGRKIPTCLTDPLRAQAKHTQPLEDDSTWVLAGYSTGILADSGGCLQWEYSPEGLMGVERHGHTLYGGSNIVNSDGSDWIQPDSEYVVFLHLVDYGYDTANDYCTVWNLPYGSVAGMYKVSSGIVQDPKDDFGFGANQGVADFVAGLRRRIYEIKHP
jgi:hypothetical protein